MADEKSHLALALQGGPNQNQCPNQNPQNTPPNQSPQNLPLPLNPFVPNAPQALKIPCVPQLNWSYFKPKYSGKPDDDVEAHLLSMNDWINTHDVPDQVKVQRFCLTLVGEARLWYESNVDWAGLQNIFRQQYSKIGNTREQLFHMWRSFHFDENVETIFSYVNCIRQVATLFEYQEPQILEVFKTQFLQNYTGFSFP